MDAVTTYRLYAANEERTRKLVQQDPIVSREVQYYQENISSVKSPQDLIDNPRLLKFALSAYGLEEMEFAKALIKKALDEGIDDDKAFANQVVDSRYNEFVTDFNFKRYDSATTAFSRVTEGVVDKYYQANMEKTAGDENVGARLAMYFERKAGEMTDAYDILGDPAMLQVVQTAFNMPSEMSFSSIERQAEIINDRLDIADLSDPEAIDKMVTRFLALWDLNNPNAGASTVPLVSIGTGIDQGNSLNLLSAISTIKSNL